jgi:hypothetical protein
VLVQPVPAGGHFPTVRRVGRTVGNRVPVRVRAMRADTVFILVCVLCVALYTSHHGLLTTS